MGFFKRETRQNKVTTLEELLIQGGLPMAQLSKEQVLSIPAVSACVELICNTVASTPIKLYKEINGEIKPIIDPRTDLLNDETGDTLDGWQMKRAVIEDFLLMGNGYMYINRVRNTVKSLNFVDERYISIVFNIDPIFKKFTIQVNGEYFQPYQFIKVARKSKNGATGFGVVKENNLPLSVAYNSMIFEKGMVMSGGNRRGFLKSAGRLSDAAMKELQKAWKNLYSQSDEHVVILNNGLDFKEATQTSVELQFNEHKKSNAEEICKMFLVPPSLLDGTANQEEYNNWVKLCISPIMNAFETALNKDLLLPSEKEKLFFAFDTSELTKGTMLDRFKAYEIGVKAGIIQIDEARYKENMSPLGLKFIRLGLQDVLYFPESEEIYTPNTNSRYDINEPPDNSQNQQPNGQNPQPNQPNQPNDVQAGNTNPQGGQKQNENVSNNAGPSTSNQQSTVSSKTSGSGRNNNKPDTSKQ